MGRADTIKESLEGIFATKQVVKAKKNTESAKTVASFLGQKMTSASTCTLSSLIAVAIIRVLRVPSEAVSTTMNATTWTKSPLNTVQIISSSPNVKIRECVIDVTRGSILQRHSFGWIFAAASKTSCYNMMAEKMLLMMMIDDIDTEELFSTCAIGGIAVSDLLG